MRPRKFPTASSIALRDTCPRPTASEWNVVGSVPFSSTRKWSALTFASGSTWILGAPEIVLKNVDQAAQLLANVDELAKRGKRVLALVSGSEPLDAAVEALALPTSLHPAALIILGEKIRAGVAETIRYFEEQGVAVKVISGDHAETVVNSDELFVRKSPARLRSPRLVHPEQASFFAVEVIEETENAGL